MKKNKAYLLEKLEEKTKMTKLEIEAVSSILNDHFIIGHNNKEKIKNDFMSKLNLNEEEADKLYNICAEIIVKGVFDR